MNGLHGRDFARDIRLVRSISAKLDKRISKDKIPPDKIDRLSVEELQDLNSIVSLANFVLCKYEDKKDIKAILENFVSIIYDTCRSIDGIDDEIAELLANAEDSIGRVKCMHTNISDKSDLRQARKTGQSSTKTSANNLTNIATEINTLEYLQNPRRDDAQVI